MQERIITKETIKAFGAYLLREEKSAATAEKYLRDVRSFAEYLGGAEVSKAAVIRYKSALTGRYRARSINSVLASLNSLFAFQGWYDCRVRSVKLQRQIFCPEEKELTREEYT